MLKLTGMEKLLANIKVDERGCWIWQLSKRGPSGHSYAQCSKKDHPSRSGARWAYEMCVDLVPAGLLLRHKCDNPPCVNPEHLEPGTHKDNSQDMMERGRWKPPGRLPSTEPARRALAAKYLDDAFRRAQGQRIIEGQHRVLQEKPCANCGSLMLKMPRVRFCKDVCKQRFHAKVRLGLDRVKEF